MKYILILAVLCVPLMATTKTATGSGTWSGATWSPAGTPTASDDVLINDGITVTCNTTCAAKTLACTNAGGTCVFNGSSGSFTYHGQVTMGASNWTMSAGFSIVHDDDGTTTNHFIWQSKYGGKLVLNGSSGSHITWGIAPGSGYAGAIGNDWNSSGSTGGLIDCNYTDFSDIWSVGSTPAFFSSLTASGSVVSYSNCTFANSGYFYLNNIDSNATVSFTNNTYSSGFADGNGRVFNILGLPATGTHAFTGNYWESGAFFATATSDNLDVAMTFQDNFCYVNSTSYKCLDQANLTGGVPSFSGTNWQNNVLWVHNPSNGSTQTSTWPSGTSTRTYIMQSTYIGATCSTDYGLTNYHPTSDIPGIPLTLDGIIIEVDCSDDGPSGDLIENNSSTLSAAMEVKNSITLPAPPHNSNGAFLSYQNGGSGARHINAHNNTIVDTGVSPSGTACGVGVETGAGVAGQYQYIRDNIFWQVSTTYGVGCGAEGNSSTVANLYETADHNAFFNVTGAHYRNSGSVFTNVPGTGDQTGDPQFVDSTRNFLKFCQSLDGSITSWDGCRPKFKARTSGFTPAALIDYVRAGFAPQAAFIATMSTTGSYVGAVAPPTSTATMAISGATLKGATIK